MRYSYLFSFALLLSVPCFGQNNGYISTDSIYREGYVKDQRKIFLNRKVSFALGRKTSSSNYFPEDLNAYGIKDDHYVSRFVQEGDSKKKYFLLKLVDKNVKLYSLKINKGYRFFSEKDSVMIELKKDSSFQETLSQILVDNSFKGRSTTRFNQNSLKRAFYLYNKSYKGFFPSFRKGIYFGLSKSELLLSHQNSQTSLVYPANISNKPSSISVSNKISPLFGVFAEMPLAGTTSFINVQLYIQHAGYEQSKIESNRTVTLKASATSLNLPVVYKYRTTGLKVRSFINAGPIFSYNLKKETTLSSTDIFEKDKNFYKISSFQLGGTIGAGLEFSISQVNSIGLEFRYNVGTGLGTGDTLGNSKNQKMKELQLITSFYF